METEPQIISHLYNDGEWHIQTNEEHCKGVAELAASFAKEFGYEQWGYLLGLLHDRGKERRGFQQYIRQNSGYDDMARSVDPHFHSAIGAIVGHSLKGYDTVYWISNPIAGHHRGLYDTDELEAKVLSEKIPSDVDGSIPDVKLPMPTIIPRPDEFSQIERMLFSCLVDADRLDTERFMKRENYEKRGGGADLQSLRECLNAFLEKLGSKESSPINIIRRQIQEYCRNAAGLTPGFFELTVPTGGGKTIASVLWAIEHAIAHGKKRIVIAIPFTSIIVQTVAILRSIFGSENVLEHHSAVSESENDRTTADLESNTGKAYDIQLAAENWDAPIVVTTNVQLFESMFSNKPGACRKLHSLCNSVVVLDEVQCLPMSLLQPIVDAMKSYVKLFGTSFLFCTASQPVLDGNWRGNSQACFKGIERKKIREIIPKEMALHDRMRRVRLEFDLKDEDYSTIAERISRIGKVLCIVNTRKTAYEIYSRLPESLKGKYHLSRQMCQAHILDTLNEIKERLSEGDDVAVVSTQLIEAGVDIDFPVVFRELAGLDSILQAAGRCNREGKSVSGTAHVFSLAEAGMATNLKEACYVMRDLIDVMQEADWFSADVMRKYYEHLYARVSSYDKPEIAEKLSKLQNCEYEAASKAFKMIDDNGMDVIVNYGAAPSLIEELKNNGFSKALSRKLGRYSVTINKSTFDEFRKVGLIEEVAPEVYYIPLKDQYDKETGLKTDNQYLEQPLVV